MQGFEKKIFLIIGIILLAVGVIVMIAGFVMNARMYRCREVTATVVDTIESTEHNSDIDPRNHRRRSHTSFMYTSVYEYNDGSEVKTYTSHVSTSNRAEIGSQATLYISEDGRVYERSSALICFIIGAGFVLVGSVFTVIGVKLKGAYEAKELHIEK